MEWAGFRDATDADIDGDRDADTSVRWLVCLWCGDVVPEAGASEHLNAWHGGIPKRAAGGDAE